ncbi:hypothetical protein [Legionella gresilensis]|uniref:hypothetical protein n=1 Tax=Legionella gresilensis TaxID=91823 RepID=UPI001040FDF9|nr:hypothetical protein [Legionella gresilensis]
MRYYFNTPDQISGDEAYNELNFAEALIHYKRALQTLNQLASQRNFKRSNDYRYAFTYVIGEIIQTSCDAIKEIIEEQETFKLDSIKDLWTEIPGLINELESVFNEMGDTGKDNIRERIASHYKLLAEVCDSISEGLSDGLDDESLNERDVLSALSWLNKSITYLKRANLPIQTDLHLGYLNLLEKAYKFSSDKNFLLQITQYIINNKLLDLPFTSTQTLEMLSYQLLVAIESNDPNSAKQLIEKFEEVSLNSDIDKDNYIIEDIQNLIDKFTAQQENNSLRKRKLKKPNQTPLADLDNDLDILITKPSKRAKNVILEDTDLEDIGANLATGNIPTPMNVQPSQSAYPKDLPNISQTIDRTFFGKNTKPAKKVSFKENDYSYVSPFIKILNELSEKFSNPEFLANILSLIADFYYETKLPIKNTPLLARELYESVLLIVPNHPVAKARKNINHATVHDNNYYGSESSIANEKDPKAIFIGAIEALTMQVEVFTADNIEKINDILNRNVSFVTNSIVSKNIAGRKSAEIAKQIQSRYDYLSTHERAAKGSQVPSDQQNSVTLR